MGVDKKQKQRKTNPFELKFNKSKHDILGRKKGAQVGAPTASRKRAHEQREQTLGVEYDRKNKISKIVDKRLGEKDGKSEEEKGAMRFTEERVKNYKRASKFNLTDDGDEEEEVLTHKGKALSDIEKYDKSMISDSDDDEEPGNLGSNMVKVAHFGGGEKTAEEHVREKISREDMISNLIAKTKLARHEKQQQKDELELMTESLDSKYQALMGKMKASFRPTGRQPLEKDDYDKLTITLKTEADARATPADRKLSEEEEALKEKERLETLEAARISKNNAFFNAKSHLSADADVDIDAGSKADARKVQAKNSRFEVKFDDEGGLIDEDTVEKSRILKKNLDGSDESDDDEDLEDEEEDLDDLLEDEDELEEDSDDEEAQEAQKVVKKAKKSAPEPAETLPFVFEMPKNYKKFCALLEKHSESMDLVLERLVKCHHPSLKEGNKKRLNKLFLLCLRWFDDMSKEELTAESVKEMNLAQETMHALMKFDIQYGVRCVRALIRQHWKGRQDKQKSSPVSFGLISAIRLVSGLFPVADSWHPVVVPALFLATEALCSAKCANLNALAKQIQLANAIVEYVSESKRYVPELVAFARSALLLAVTEKSEKFATNGFPISKPHTEMLCFEEKYTGPALQPISLTTIFNNSPSDPSLKLHVLRALLSLIQHLRVIYSNQNETYSIVFKPFLRILESIQAKNLPAEVQEELETLCASMKAEIGAKCRLVHLSLVKTEKSMLKMLEPRFEWDFDPERPHHGPKDEKKKLTKNLRNERRGAIKELRKDTAFLARKQLSSVKTKDRARIAATKRVMGGLMQQQGEWNKEKRTADVEKKKDKK
ncbi:Nucleolar protein 14 [Caenorhabditis elegans]|uniref:Nucleolar protein 14 n=1 Tax=Caenorhabditis elegans TaxID=6239 RepID=Q9N3Q9_CAEEL|nr:Nucleolar protein 14 [Caenorhabditis elegans]CCD67942.2 Nucleolar protein 14 [Caenorhabditis elegans]|eukprot:NP_001350972.1 NucleOLar protein [Caenorhabditis elegans]